MRVKILLGLFLGWAILFVQAVPVQAIPPHQDPYPTIRIIPGTVVVNDDVALAIRAALAQAGSLVPSAEYFSLSALRSADDWVFVSLVGLSGVGVDLKWNFLEHVNWFGVALLRRDLAGRWAGAVEGTPAFSQLLTNVPDALLDRVAKQTLDPLQRPMRAPLAGYPFPWTSGREMQYGTLGVHTAGFYSGWKAVDFLSDGDTSVNNAPNSLRASEAGAISYVCNDGTSVAIRINNLLYVHLINNSNLYTGKTFNQGDEIGQLKTGSFSNTCGYASQQSNWFHVHWGFPDTGSFQAEDWTLSLSDGLWRRNTETRGVGSWFQAGGGSTTNCTYSADQIVLYENSNYGGNCKTFSLGEYANPSAMGFANDSASSIRVGSNVKATLCHDDNYAGGCEDFTGDDSDLNGNSIGDNQVSSLKVASRGGTSCGDPSADQVTLYVDTNYGGQCATKNIGEYANPSAIGLPNDAISSLKVGSNVIATLCKNDNFNDCMNFDRTDANIGDDPIGDNQVSSVKVITRFNPPSAPTLASPSNGASLNEGDAINLVWSATGDQYYGEIWGGPAMLTFGWQNGTSNNIGSQWAGYTYSWHVKAKNGSGESGYSDTWTFTVKPHAPSSLNASAASCTQVNLTWVDNSGNEEGYKIYRNGASLNQVGAGVTSYADTNASGSTSYTYVVKAFRGTIESAASNTANVTTASCVSFTRFVDAVKPVAPYCVVRNSNYRYDRLLEIVGRNFISSDHLQFRKVSNGETSIHFNQEVDWLSATRGALDFGRIKSMLWSDSQVTLQVRVTAVNTYQPLSDWSAQFTLANDVATCGNVRPSPTPFATACPTCGLPASAWPVFQHDAQHTGRSPNQGPTQPITKWSVGPVGTGSAPAIGADGTIYVGLGKQLRAYQPNGALKWSYTSTGYVNSPLVISDGTIIAGTDDGKVFALTSSGALRWTVTTGGWIGAAPAVGPDGTIYIGSADGKLYALNSNGGTQWTYNIGSWINPSIAIGADGIIYLGSTTSSVYAILPNGTLNWDYATTSYVDSSPAIAPDGTVYIGSVDKYLYALTPSGGLKWRYATNGAISSSPAIGSDGTVYIGSQDSKLYAIRPDGTMRWSYLTGASINSSPTIGADGTIYAGANDGKLYALNANGTLKWSHLLAGWLDRGPVIGHNQTLYIGSATSGNLYAVGETTWGAFFLPFVKK